MKKLLPIMLLAVFISNCASFGSFTQKPCKTKNFKEYAQSNVTKPSSQKPETEDLYQGMTMTLVKENLGEPRQTEIGEDGIVIWHYPNAKLFFLDDVLFTWK